MTHAHPNALSLAVAITISSSIIATQALADRRLQTKSIVIQDNGHTEFIQSEVIVKPTLGDDQQPITKSFTTTYPDRAEFRADYDIPSKGFTDVLSGIDGGVSTVDLFETDDNDIAQKYTKVLKVGNEAVFRFTHNFSENKLLIEVRDRMTHKDSIGAVRSQLGDNHTLEPFTKIASPEHLVGVLKGVNERAGNLGEVDHYVVLANLEVDQVEVKGRTFMRLIVSSDQPPELQRLGQSIFVNDETLLAAATSAYTQVHVLGKDLQQGALEDLLSFYKPVGYVVHVEDDTQVYPVPEDYPKLEVTVAEGEIIVFHGQKQNPTDIAFVEGLYDIWEGFYDNGPTPETIALVKKDKFKSYQYVIRSRQLALLEELAAQHITRLDEGGKPTDEYEDTLASLIYYEYILQALTSATSDQEDGFVITRTHIKLTSSFITPTWMHIQLTEHFGFKPILRNFLTNRKFIQNIHEIMSVIAKMSGDPFDDSFDADRSFASKVAGVFAEQLLEMEHKLEKLQVREAMLAELNEAFQRTGTMAMTHFEEKLRAVGLNQPVVNELKKIRQELEETKNSVDQLEQDNKRIPELEKQLLATRAKATNTPNSEMAAEFDIEPDEDDTSEDRALETRVSTKLLRLAELEEELDDIKTPGHPKARPEVLETLSVIEKALEIRDLDEKEDVYLRRRYISENMQENIRDARQQAEREALDILEVAEEILDIEANKEDNKIARLEVVMKTLDSDALSEEILDESLEEIGNIRWAYEGKTTDLDEKEYKRTMLLVNLRHKVEDPDMRAREKLTDLLEAIETILNIKFNKEDGEAERLARIYSILEGNDVSEKLLDQIDQTLWKGDSTALNKRDIKHNKLRGTLTYKVEDSYLDKFARDQQTSLLGAIEDELSIYPHENVAATERGKAFTAKLARDLNLAFGEDSKLYDQKEALKARVQALMDEVHEAYDDVGVRRARNNELAHQLKIENYKDDATIDNQNILIEAKLNGLLEEIFNAGQSAVNVRIATIENELDKQIARLGPKPRYVLDREKANAKRALAKAESELTGVRRKLHALRGKHEVFTSCKDNQGLDEAGIFEEALAELPLARKKYTLVTQFLQDYDSKSMEVNHAQFEESNAQEKLDHKKQEIIDFGDFEEQDKTAHNKEITALGLVLEQKSEALSKAKDTLTDFHKTALDATEEAVGLKPDTSETHEQRVNNLRNKQVQLGGDDGTGGKILQMTHKLHSLNREIEVRKAKIEKLKEVLKAAEQAVENEGGPFQFTPWQVKVLTDMHDFMQDHSLKKQALEAAMGLAELAVENGKKVPYFTIFDFDDELAPVRLRALVGEGLTFDQANRIVKVFKSLKTTFPTLSSGALKLQPPKVLSKVQGLVFKIRHQLQNGAQEYDDVVYAMGKTAIHYIEYEPRNLESFPEYLATRFAGGKKTIALLREGLISKVELESYMKAVRGVDGYQTVDEFEHFLGYRHAVRVPEFKKVVQMLSDEWVEEFIENTFTPVSVTSQAGMKESVAGMKEYAAAVIANYILDDIAFENGRRTAAFLTNVQDTLAPYANAVGVSESDLIQAIHGTLMQAHAAAVDQQLNNYWVKPSAFLAQIVTWYYSSYKPLLVTQTAVEAAILSLSNLSLLYLLDFTNRGDYTHRMIIPFQHWLEGYSVDHDRTGQYAYHNEIEKFSEVGGLAMPLGRAASSVVLLKTGSLLFARQYNANPR
ncbi:hypothetical protein, partial [Endozoicomonas sp. SESOKO3]